MLPCLNSGSPIENIPKGTSKSAVIPNVRSIVTAAGNARNSISPAANFISPHENRNAALINPNVMQIIIIVMIIVHTTLLFDIKKPLNGSILLSDAGISISPVS